MLLTPIALCGFIHLWKPADFPFGLSNDEAIYLRRAIHVLNGLGPQEGPFYDHPYFAQLFLAGIFKAVGYPHSLHPVPDGKPLSIEMLYLVPRILTGVLSMVDTFLLFKITDLLYNRKVAFLAAMLFAVMPIGSELRWVHLEPIQLSLFLSSILFAIYFERNYNYKIKGYVLILLSGIFLGLAIFTKIPAFTMIPLVGFLIYKSNKKLKSFGIWFLPVIIIPLIWPAYALSIGQLDQWWSSVYLQTQRANQTFFSSLKYNFMIDPLFVTIAAIALFFTILVQKDLFILLWVAPFLVFLYLVGFVSYWHFIPVIPVACIAGARMIVYLSNVISSRRPVIGRYIPYIFIVAVGVFGLLSTAIAIISSDNSTFFEATAFLTQYLHDNASYNVDDGIDSKLTLIGNPAYLWIPQYVFQFPGDYIGYYENNKHIRSNIIVEVLDNGLKSLLSKNNAAQQIELLNKNRQLYDIKKLAEFEGQADNKNNAISVYEFRSRG
jgi:hypothetical protein